MSREDAIRQAEATFRKLLEDVYQSGFEAGVRSVRDTVLNAVAHALPADTALHRRPVLAHEEYEKLIGGADARVQRAPRGLTAHVLSEILHSEALEVDEIQRRAVAADSRLNAKTVYNELYRGQDDKYLKSPDGRWRLNRLPSKSAREPHAPQERDSMEAPTAR